MPRGRKKGSKLPITIMKENQNIIPVKEVRKKNTTVDDRIKKLSKKRGRPICPKHVLRLTDWLYITCDQHCWKVVEINDSINSVTGVKYPDKPILYAGTFQGILQVAVNHMIKVPDELNHMSEKLDDIYRLIEKRIPKNVKPKNLFEDCISEVSDDE